MPLNEADTCRRYVVPKLQAAGWDDEPHRLNEQVTFTDGRIVVIGQKGRRRIGKRADYILRYRALARIPRFAMARGNRGHGLSYYSRALYDRSHMAMMMLAAHDDLSATLEPSAFFDSPDYQRPKAAFRQRRDEIASHMDVTAVREHFSKHTGSLGRSKSEQAYRRWCGSASVLESTK